MTPRTAADGEGLARGFQTRRARLLVGLQRNRQLGAAVVVATVLVGYASPRASNRVFIAALLLFVLQWFATGDQARLFAVSRACSSLSGNLPAERIGGLWIRGAALAVWDAYFVLFLCFDASWLFHDLILPAAPASFDEYLRRLAFGWLSGGALLTFTVFFWFAYAILLAFGRVVARELDGDGPGRYPFSASVPIWGGKRICLNGVHLAGKGTAPAIILWPGFTQNGHIWDLDTQGGSLAGFLQQQGFDVWIFHSRGTGGSEGKDQRSSLDDLAAFDIPAAVTFVSARCRKAPTLVAHSMGGICALISLMGADRRPAGAVRLDDDLARQRQQSLSGLVVLGAFPDFTFARESGLQRFVRRGVKLRILGLSVWIPITLAVPFLRGFRFLGIPVGLPLRRALADDGFLRWLLFPVDVLLRLIAQLEFWEFLYHRPNAPRDSRRRLLFATIDGTFWDIIEQYREAVLRGSMLSADRRVSYSGQYGRIQLPTAVVAMEHDSLADPERMRSDLYERLGGSRKSFTLWRGLGHEDHFMNVRFFPLVEEAIRSVTEQVEHRME